MIKSPHYFSDRARVASLSGEKRGSLPLPRPLEERAKPRRAETTSLGASRSEYRDMLRHWASAWADVIRMKAVPQDLLSGLTVAAVALPLNLALAVASGVPPAAGLIAGAVGGALAATFGGAPLSVTGPAAALNVMVLAVAAQFGVVGVAAAALLVGVVQIAMGVGRTGKLITYVPEAVLVGFTTGVGIKLLDNQIPELLGFDYKVFELAQMLHRPNWLRQVSWTAVLCGLFVAFLVVSMSRFKRFPAALVGIAIVTGLANFLDWDTMRVGEIPSSLPFPAIPAIEASQWLPLFWAILPLAVLAGAESLLAARAVERMAPAARKTQLNLELVGQGIANVGSGLFSGMPVSAVIVRSGVNVQSGAKSRLSSLVHAMALLFAVMFLSDRLATIPLAALAGLLCVVGVRLIELGTLAHLYKTEKLGALAFVVTATGTVTGHLIAGLAGGMVIHGLHMWLTRGDRAREKEQAAVKASGVKAFVPKSKADARRPAAYEPPAEHKAWLRNITARAQRAASAFVHDQANLIGSVVLGEHVHIAAGSSVRADEGTPFFIGSNSNVQDGVVIHALKDKKVQVGGEQWAVYVGQNVSIAHDALVHGPCFVGDGTFIGFKAVVHDSIVGEHCFIGIGAVVVGVEIPDHRFVPHGMIVDTADKADQLPHVTDAQMGFNEDVVDVNRGLATAYHKYAQGVQRVTVSGSEGAGTERVVAAPRSLPQSVRRLMVRNNRF